VKNASLQTKAFRFLEYTMADRTITRADLTEAISHKAGLSRSEAADLVSQVLSEICDCLAAGESVKLSGFGIFTVCSRSERVGRNPRTKVEAPIPPHRAITFRASEVLKKQINRESHR